MSASNKFTLTLVPHFIINQKGGTSDYRMGNLLDVPIHRLMDELSAATAAKLSRPYAFTNVCHINESLTSTLTVTLTPHLLLRLAPRYHG